MWLCLLSGSCWLEAVVRELLLPEMVAAGQRQPMQRQGIPVVADKAAMLEKQRFQLRRFFCLRLRRVCKNQSAQSASGSALRIKPFRSSLLNQQIKTKKRRTAILRRRDPAASPPSIETSRWGSQVKEQRTPRAECCTYSSRQR